MSVDFLQLRVSEAVRCIRSKTRKRPAVALVLGSGLGDFADAIQDGIAIPTRAIPNYPRSTVAGHAGKIVIGKIRHAGKSTPTLIVFKGRVHFYETGDLHPTVLPIHVAHALGAKSLIITNAAGGINRSFKPGDLMLIRDVITFSFLNDRHLQSTEDPTRGIPHFDASLIHRRSRPPLTGHLMSTVRNAAAEIGLPLREGTYCWLKGPSYETAAEIEMLHRLAVDAVGMSTVPEISAAAALGMDVVALSLISNLATGISPSKLSHDEVTETADRVKQQFATLLKHVLIEL